MARTSGKTSPKSTIRPIEERLGAIQKMGVRELQQLWKELYGENTSSRNTVYLRRRMSFRIQELASGAALSSKAEAKVRELASAETTKAPRAGAAAAQTKPRAQASTKRDPRLPKPGTVIEREYKGKRYTVTVHESDFEYRSERYTSLSTVAREITGQIWNGFLFWGLTGRGTKKGAA